MEKWQDPRVIALWIAIIIVIILTILCFVVWIVYTGYKRMTEANLREARMQVEHQKSMLQNSLQTQESERERIAADLHDSLIGKLTIIKLKNQTAYNEEQMDVLLEESIAEARRISHDLSPPMLDFISLDALLLQALNPWKVRLKVTEYFDVRTQPEIAVSVKIQLLRIIQEIFVNINKHAAATEITFNYRQTTKGLAIYIADNGKGFDAALLKKGLGLNNIEIRIQYLGGKYKIKSAPGKGTATLMVLQI
ncbi:sensor histidine kinase [Flavobacterium rhizosphaerae]|uniref:histidine kinase n=1 Tax=Flavobacterium rhizosphaerae TaxID=3163298 RepID=A0ABW8YSB6_9FLAO